MNRIKSTTCVAFVAVIFLNFFANSQTIAPNTGIQEVRKIDTTTRSNFLAKAGGFIKAPAKGSSVRIINAQTRVPSEIINEVANSMQLTFRYSVVAVTSKDTKDGPAWVEETLKQPDTAAVLVIIDAAGQPPLVLAPEARWAIMNIAALCTKDMKADTLADRTRKQLWRAYGYLMGAANSSTDQCVMRTVFKPEDLDGLKFQTLGLEPIIKIQQQAAAYGITPERMTTYRKACEEGWAPMPTNQLQRAVWEEVKKAKDTK